MLFLYLCVGKNDDDYEIHEHISTYLHDNRCLIYYYSYEYRLYVFINDNNVIEHLEKYTVIPISDAHNIVFKYMSRIPTGSWKSFSYPYNCDPSIVYDLDNVYKTFTEPIVDNYAINSMLLYHYKERYDTKNYDILISNNRDITPTVCTSSDISRLVNNNDKILNALKLVSQHLDYDSVSNLIYAIVGDRLVCVSPCKKLFYIFSGIWYLDESYSFIYRFIMDELINYVKDYNDKKLCDINENDLLNLINRKREEIITRISYKCESKYFCNILDSKLDIIAFANGVYDFKTSCLRNSLPEDYLSIAMEHNYIHDVDTTKLLELLSTFFPIPEILDFFLDTVSLVMGGRNYEKLVVVWLGKTDTGKSTCQEFLEYVLGEYCGTLPSSMFTGKRNNPHGTTSAISSIGSKRLLFLQEPEEARINSSQLKSMSSNDKIYTRELYQKATVSRIKAIITIVTNGTIDLSACDEASLSRLVVIPFINTFETSRIIHRKCTGIADVNMIHKLIIHSEAMIKLLVDRYKKYMTQGYRIPEIIKQHTVSFMKESNPILFFINTYGHKSAGVNTGVSIAYSMFVIWYKESYPGTKTMSMHYFRETLKSSGYQILDNNILEYYFK